MVDPWSAGEYGTELPDEKGVRRLRALCFVRSEANDNGYARPIDSMVVVVDLYKMEVTHIEEYPIAPLPPEPGNWAREYIPNVRTDLKPVEITQPEGTSFTVTGNQVEWQKWKFRVGFTSREGLVLHTITSTMTAWSGPSCIVPRCAKWWCLMAIQASNIIGRMRSTSENMAWACLRIPWHWVAIAWA
jgi:Cu2+-containing amine oxidase